MSVSTPGLALGDFNKLVKERQDQNAFVSGTLLKRQYEKYKDAIMHHCDVKLMSSAENLS